MSDDYVEVSADDLRCLLFWASVGVHLSKGGFRQEDIPDILTNQAEYLRFALPYKPEFQAGED
jgi:hypothetical protein